MKFCANCGQSVSQLVPRGDNRVRNVCNHCGTIHYSNPNNVCGTILTHGDRVLLCRRSINPRYGLWTLPAGFMENGETVSEAAAREAVEEANAHADELRLFGVFNLPHISQVYLMFRGELTKGQHSAGQESLETNLFSHADIPWGELAFPVVDYSLRLFFDAPEYAGVYTATAERDDAGRVLWVDR